MDIAAALAMPGLGLAITVVLPATPVADTLSQAARRVAITEVARLAVVVTTAAADSAAAADSTAVVVVGSAAATVVAAADTGKEMDRRKRLAEASRFLLCVTSSYLVAFKKVFTFGVP